MFILENGIVDGAIKNVKYMQYILDERPPGVGRKAFFRHEHRAFRSRLAYVKVLSQASIQRFLAALVFLRHRQMHAHSFLHL